jgi:hypothetical protein
MFRTHFKTAKIKNIFLSSFTLKIQALLILCILIRKLTLTFYSIATLDLHLQSLISYFSCTLLYTTPFISITSLMLSLWLSSESPSFFILLCSSSFWLQLIFPYTILLISHQYLSVLSSSLRQLSRSYDGLYWSIIFAFWRHFRSADHALTGSLLGVGHYTRRNQQLLQDGTWCLLELFVDSKGMSGILCFLMSRKKMRTILESYAFGVYICNN